MDLSNFTEEQLEKAKACKTPDEIVALVQEEGVELTEEQLEAVSGGGGTNIWGQYGVDNWGNVIRPFCKSTNVQEYTRGGKNRNYECLNCGGKSDNDDFAPAYSD